MLDLSKFPLASSASHRQQQQQLQQMEEEEEEEEDEDEDMSKYDLMAGSDDDTPSARYISNMEHSTTLSSPNLSQSLFFAYFSSVYRVASVYRNFACLGSRCVMLFLVQCSKGELSAEKQVSVAVSTPFQVPASPTCVVPVPVQPVPFQVSRME